MKRFIACMLVMVLFVAMVSGCANKKEQSVADNGTEQNSTENNSSDPNENDSVTDEREIKSAVLIISGNLGDKGFSDLAYAGMKRAESELGLRIKVVELGGDNTKQIPVLTEFAEDPEWDLIVSGTYGMKESIQKVAEEHPDARFLVYDAEMNYEGGKLSNVCSMEHRQYEASFLAGALAAALTSSGEENTNPEKLVGFVGGGENVSINDFLVGYIQGVQYVNDTCKVLISYVGDFTNTAKAKEMTIAQCNQGADIIYAVAGGASLGVLDGAAEMGCFSIGVDQDQYEALKDNSPELAAHIVSSVVKRLDNTVFTMINGAYSGTLSWGTHSYVGLAENSMGIAANEQYGRVVPEDIQKMLSDVEEKLRSGELTPKSAFGMSTEEVTEYKNSAKP